MERDKALDVALSQIEKQFGKGSVMRMGENLNMGIESIPTGAMALDMALGIGGLPRGRIVEVYGPESSGKSTLAMHVVAEAQRNGGICAYIDAEHAMDPVYATAIGVNIDDLLISQPDTGEQALEIADMLIRSGALDVIVVDSVAALTPRAEIEGDMGDAHVGLQARLMSQALRKLTGTLSKSDTIALFINQLREKIGIMYGCFDYSTRVVLADGTKEEIGKIVTQRLPVEVLSYDPKAGAVVPKRVVNWFDNGETEAFLQFTVAKSAKPGRSQFACTPNHLIRTPVGWREAGELKVGDNVMTSLPHHLSPFQWQALKGTLMGDGAISMNTNGHAGRFRYSHGARQVDYADWKASLFANVDSTRHIREDGVVTYDFTPLPELAELRRSVYTDGKKTFDDDYLKSLTPLSLALWYQDDAAFTIRSKGKQTRFGGITGRAEICVEAMEPATRTRLVDYLADTWGICPKLMLKGKVQKAVLVFPSEETRKLQILIARFVHPSMQYKLLPQFRGRFGVEPVMSPMRYELVAMPVMDIQVKVPTRSNHRFDIEVEDSHNYMVDGVVVHNSPEVTPGGRALKFYASVRLDIRRVEAIKDGADVIGSRTRVKVVKNKCVADGTQVFDPTTGLTHRIEDIVDRDEGTSVVAVDKLGKLHSRPIVTRMDQGEHEVIGLHLRGATVLNVTADHEVLTSTGWRQAGDLAVGDRLARPRRAIGFGEEELLPPEHARMLGYLIGDGCVTGKTPISFTNILPELHEDAAAIAASLGCDAHARGIQVSYSHRKGEKNQLLALARWAGIWGHTAPEKKIPAAFFDAHVSAEVVGNLLFGIWESDGWVSREQTGGLRCGFATTSEQLAHQIHWLLLRWGIVSSIRINDPRTNRPSVIKGQRVQGKLPCYQVRVSGMDNVDRFAQSLPMWGPKGRVLSAELNKLDQGRHRGSQSVYLAPSQTEPVLAYLTHRGVTAELAARLVGDMAGNPQGGLKQVLGVSRLRRDRLQLLADALESDFLHEVLDEDVWYDRIVKIDGPQWRPIYDLEVEDLHTFVADDVVISNCSSPFKVAEFDIMYGTGISREGSLLDVGVELGFIKKSGAWFTYEGEQLGQGRENAKQFLRETPELMIEINEKIRSQLAAVVLPAGAAVGVAANSDGDANVAADSDDLPISVKG